MNQKNKYNLKKIIDYLLVVVMLFALQSCSNDDEPKHVDPENLTGEWYLTNIRGWEYVDDAHNKKSEFNETFNFNGKGIPVSDNAINAQKIYMSIVCPGYNLYHSVMTTFYNLVKIYFSFYSHNIPNECHL